jgi:3-hydroxy-9,10-secoandrosta-1,3,5(10)-triene-9,17-dione monooxygenase
MTIVMKDAVPDVAEIVGRAKALRAALCERAGEADREGRLPAATIADMQKAGFFRVLQPRRYGGFEMDPSVFYDVQMALSRGDMSTGWVYGVLGVHPWQLALFHDDAQRDVWGDDPSTLIASSYMLVGKAVREGDGFRFSGHWRFSSGVEHCKWVFLGGMVMDGDAGSPDASKFNTAQAPDARTFLLPLSECKIVKTWDVHGLKGTGSQDVIVENAFVPDYRTHKFSDGFSCTNPGNAVNTSPLYRVPFAQMFIRAVSTGCIGALEAMFDAFCEYGKVRSTSLGAKTAMDPAAQIACAETAAAIHEMKLVLRDTLANLLDYASRGEIPPMEERLLYKYQSAKVTERCSLLAARLLKSAGGTSLFANKPFGRLVADITAGGQHVANQFDTYGRNWGGTMLGLPSEDAFV